MSERKQYSPANIKNPTSMQHVVWLQPGQMLILHLDSDDYPMAKADTTSPYLKGSIFPSEGEVTRFIFLQNEQVIPWGEYSSCYLGDIWVDSAKATARIAVMMNCITPVKSRVVTVINPDCSDIRLKPHNVLELVLYNDKFASVEDEWEWSWQPKVEAPMLEFLGTAFLNLDLWQGDCHDLVAEEPSHLYARLPRVVVDNNVWCRQHHFWFRFAEPILGLMSRESSIKYLGELRFFGLANRHHKENGYYSENSLSVYVDLRKKSREETLTTLSLPGYPMSRNSLSCFPFFSRRNKGRLIPFRVYQVDLQVMNSDSLEAGCKTLDAIPQREVVDPGHDVATVRTLRVHRHFGYPSHDYGNEYPSGEMDQYNWRG